jgi:DUF1680 family protein
MDTAYPYDGAIRVKLTLEQSERFALSLRVPYWCEDATLTLRGEGRAVSAGYVTAIEEWQSGDELILHLPMRVKRVLPPKGAVNEEIFAAYTYGPLVLAADKRITDPDAVLNVLCDARGYAVSAPAACPEIREAALCLEVPLESGERVRLINYGSAGKTWTEESRCAAWLYRKK